MGSSSDSSNSSDGQELAKLKPKLKPTKPLKGKKPPPVRDSSSSSSSSSDDDDNPKPPTKKKVVKRVVVKKVVMKKKAGEADASTHQNRLPADQRAALIMARANANKPRERGLSSDEEDGPALPKLPGQANNSSDTSDDDVVVPEFGVEVDAPRKTKSATKSAEEQRALKEIEDLRKKRVALQKSRLAGTQTKAAATKADMKKAPPPMGALSDSDSDESDDSDSDILPNGVEETWIDPVGIRPGLNVKKTRVWMLAMNLPAPILAQFVGMKSSQLLRLCDAHDQSAMIKEHGFDGAIFRSAVRHGVRKALQEDGAGSDKEISKRLKANGLLGSFDTTQGSGSDSEQEQQLKDLVQRRAGDDTADDFQIIQPKMALPSRRKRGSSSSDSSSSTSSSSSSDDDDSSSESDIPLPEDAPAPPPADPAAAKVVGRLYFADGTHTAHVFLPGVTAKMLCQAVFDKQKLKKPELAARAAQEFGLFDETAGVWIDSSQNVIPFVQANPDVKLVFQVQQQQAAGVAEPMASDASAE